MFVKRAIPCSSVAATAVDVFPGGAADNEQLAPATGRSRASLTTTFSVPDCGVWPEHAAAAQATSTSSVKYRRMGDIKRMNPAHFNHSRYERLARSSCQPACRKHP